MDGTTNKTIFKKFTLCCKNEKCVALIDYKYKGYLTLWFDLSDMLNPYIHRMCVYCILSILLGNTEEIYTSEAIKNYRDILHYTAQFSYIRPTNNDKKYYEKFCDNSL